MDVYTVKAGGVKKFEFMDLHKVWKYQTVKQIKLKRLFSTKSRDASGMKRIKT